MHASNLFIEQGDSPALDHILQGLERLARASDVGGGDPGTVAPPFLPSESVGAEAVFGELERLAAGAVDVGRPGWMGHMDPPATWGSVLGAAGAAMLNNNLLMPEMSPSFTALEGEMTRGFADALGFGEGAAGTFTAGGSVANLLALTVARNVHLALESAAGRTHAEALARFTVVTSAEAHVSVEKAGMVLGLDPHEGVLRVPAREDGRLAAADVEAAIEAAEEGGRQVGCLVATAGTTVLGAIDPLRELGRVAEARGLWYHVDAAYGGGLGLSRRHREFLAGIEGADSITVNPQKWLYVAKVCAMVLFADGARWREATGAVLPYASTEDGRTGAGVEGTRAADVLKLRLALLQMGRRRYEEVIQHGFELAERVEEHVLRRPFLRLAAPRQTNIVVFRIEDSGAGDDDGPTRALQRRLVEEEDIFLSLPSFRERRWLRAVLLNPFTDVDTVERLFAAVDRFAAERSAP